MMARRTWPKASSVRRREVNVCRGRIWLHSALTAEVASIAGATYGSHVFGATILPGIACRAVIGLSTRRVCPVGTSWARYLSVGQTSSGEVFLGRTIVALWTLDSGGHRKVLAQSPSLTW